MATVPGEVAAVDGRLASELDRSTASARALLLSVLGTFVLPAGGSAWTGSLIRGLELAGVDEPNARQALARARHAGWLTNERQGRKARWHLTDRARQLLSSGSTRIYSFGLDEPSWDRRWVVLLTSVPETRRDLRYRLRTRLGWAGFGSPSAGLWMSPWAERESEADRVIAELGLSHGCRSFVGEHGQIGEVASLLDSAWDLRQLASLYTDFMSYTDFMARADFMARTDALALDNVTDTNIARALLLSTHRWRGFPTIDPGLPRELLPATWPGRRAAVAFADLRTLWQPAVDRWWTETDERAGR